MAQAPDAVTVECEALTLAMSKETVIAPGPGLSGGARSQAQRLSSESGGHGHLDSDAATAALADTAMAAKTRSTQQPSLSRLWRA